MSVLLQSSVSHDPSEI